MIEGNSGIKLAFMYFVETFCEMGVLTFRNPENQVIARLLIP